VPPHTIRAQTIAPVPWRNGGGQTRELLVWPPGAQAWQLRISLATIAVDGPFSVFAGIQRHFAVLSGAGLVLTVDGHRLQLGPDSAAVSFDGGLAAHAALMGGATQDLNLMCAGGASTMLAVTPSVDWRESYMQRGLFARRSGTLEWSTQGAELQSLDIAADTLAWFDDARDHEMRFTPAGGSREPAGFWLGFTPATR